MDMRMCASFVLPPFVPVDHQQRAALNHQCDARPSISIHYFFLPFFLAFIFFATLAVDGYLARHAGDPNLGELPLDAFFFAAM
jgi:phosphatidylglycerophosphate synthase